MVLVDLQLNKDNDIALDTRGDLALTSGLRASAQYVTLRLLTPVGTLRYDRGFGSTLDDLRGKTSFTKARLTQLARLYVTSALKPCRYVKAIKSIEPTVDSRGILVIKIHLTLYTDVTQTDFEETTLRAMVA